jgi:hypothetical protein
MKPKDIYQYKGFPKFSVEIVEVGPLTEIIKYKHVASGLEYYRMKPDFLLEYESKNTAWNTWMFQLPTGLVSLDTGCVHNMERYVGFTESYSFCTLCDYKENV